MGDADLAALSAAIVAVECIAAWAIGIAGPRDAVGALALGLVAAGVTLVLLGSPGDHPDLPRVAAERVKSDGPWPRSGTCRAHLREALVRPTPIDRQLVDATHQHVLSAFLPAIVRARPYPCEAVDYVRPCLFCCC